jgi:hypothetical protein
MRRTDPSNQRLAIAPTEVCHLEASGRYGLWLAMARLEAMASKLASANVTLLVYLVVEKCRRLVECRLLGLCNWLVRANRDVTSKRAGETS